MSWFSCVEDGLVPEQGCKPWASALDDGNAIMGPNSSDISDCEVMMMVGLPASGKTTWAEKWAEEYPEKRFVLLGRNLILDEMKVPIFSFHILCPSCRKDFPLSAFIFFSIVNDTIFF